MPQGVLGSQLSERENAAYHGRRVLVQTEAMYFSPENHMDAVNCLRAAADKLGIPQFADEAIGILFARLPRDYRGGENHAFQVDAYEGRYGMEGIRKLLQGPVTCYD